MAIPSTPQQTIQTKVDRQVRKSIDDVRQDLQQTKGQVASIQKQVNTPPTTLTPDQLAMASQALGPGGSHALYANTLLAGLPTKDPHKAGTIWNNNNVLVVSAG